MCASQTLLSQNKLSECRGRNLRLISAHDTVVSVFVLEPPRRRDLGDARPAQGIPGGSLPRQMPNAAAPGLVSQVWSSESPVPGIWGAGEDLKALVGSAGWEPPPPGQPPTAGPISWTLWSIPSAGPASSKLRILVYRDRASGTRLFCITVAARKCLSSVTSPHQLKCCLDHPTPPPHTPRSHLFLKVLSHPSANSCSVPVGTLLPSLCFRADGGCPVLWSPATAAL